jgi:TRAP-type C4-dicarboxylate transport system substrate-binding protein
MERKWFALLCVGLVVALAMGISGTGWAQEKVFKWRMQTVDDPGLMEYQEISHRFADRVRELTNGRLDIKVFPP